MIGIRTAMKNAGRLNCGPIDWCPLSSRAKREISWLSGRQC